MIPYFVGFELTFRPRILSFTPDMVFIVLACLRMAYLWLRGSGQHASSGVLHLAAKVFASLLVLGTNVAILTLSAKNSGQNTVFVWIAAPILQVISTVGLHSSHGESFVLRRL